MKPAMKDDVTVYVPTGGKDQYGRPTFSPVYSKARVKQTTQIVRTTEGEQKEVRNEIDIPSDVLVKKGTKIEFTDLFGEVIKGQVISVDDGATNLAGNKVYFRTVTIG